MYNAERDCAMREMMMDKVIRRFGFENCHTISFAMRCEDVPHTGAGQNRIINLFHSLMNLAIGEDE